MDRNKFLQLNLLGTIGLGLLPSLAFSADAIQQFSRSQLLGKGNPDVVGDSYTTTMHKDAKEAFLKMQAAAKSDGISIEVVSAYRSFQRQKEIFEGKYTRYTKQGLSPMQAIEKIIEYSTIPGTSRHHWGTDIDLIDGGVSPRPSSVLQPELFHGNGVFCRLKEWLDANAEQFGFYEVYTDNANRKGFKYEPWHFSFAPISKPMLAAYKTLDLQQIILEEDIKGAAHFTPDFLQQYRSENILDINPKLL